MRAARCGRAFGAVLSVLGARMASGQEPAVSAAVAGQGEPLRPASGLTVLVDGTPVIRLSLAEFLAQVGRENLDYAVQTFNVPIAVAQVSVARLFPNPTLAWGAGVDVSDQHQATSYDVSLTQTLLLGGKRGARTAVARDQAAAARAQLDDFLRMLRGTAGTAYVDAIHAEQVYARKRRTADDLDRLVALNEHRVKAGDIGEIDLAQSRVDAAQFHGELVSAANDVHAARLGLTGLLSPRTTDTLVAPAAAADLVSLQGVGPDAPITPALLNAVPAHPPVSGSAADTLAGGLRSPPAEGLMAPGNEGANRAAAAALPSEARIATQQRGPDVDSLTRLAVSSRPDVIAARRLRDAAAAGVRVAHGDRWSDVDISVGTSYFTRGTNTIDPTPKFSSINLGLAFPIPFSDFTHGELAAARYSAKQADKTLQSAEWKTVIDVRQAWASYQAGVAELAQYTGGVLLDAERVRRAKLYSYQHGSASLLDVLAAEQTANDVYIASYDAQQQYGHALIALGQATGTWSLVYATADSLAK